MVNKPQGLPKGGLTKDGTVSKKGAVSPQPLRPRPTRRGEALTPPVEPRDGVGAADHPPPKPSSRRISNRPGRESPQLAASPASKPYSQAPAQFSLKTTGGMGSPKTGGPQAAKLGASPEETGFARTLSASPRPRASSKPGASPTLVGSPAAIVSPQRSGSLSPVRSPARSPPELGNPAKAGPSPKSSAAPAPIVSPLPAEASPPSTPVSSRSVEGIDIRGAAPSYSAPKLQRREVAGGKGGPSAPPAPSSPRDPARPIPRGDAKATSPAEEFKASRRETRSPSVQPRWPTPTGSEIYSPLVSYQEPRRSKAIGDPARAPGLRNRRRPLTLILFVGSCTIVVAILVLIITVQIMKHQKVRETVFSATSNTVSESVARRVAKQDTTRHGPSSEMRRDDSPLPQRFMFDE
ncbi:uncharacterized protein [Dermacentor andersoni]|uniref:uncharacterized protein n=1 Tax=Dermacentor andersoni TaxID=34620 RepID=UPI003B3B14CD